MKKIIISAIALIGINFLSPGYAENLLKNPGFEEGITEWQLNASEYVNVEIDTKTKTEGSQSLRFSATEPANATIKQKVATEPSTQYTLSWNLKTTSFKIAQFTSGSVFATVYTIQKNAENKVVYGGKIIQANHKVWLRGSQYTGQNIQEDIDWNFFYFTFETSPSTKSVEIYLCLAFGGSATGTVWFDDISFSHAIKNGDTYIEKEKKNQQIVASEHIKTQTIESLPKKRIVRAKKLSEKITIDGKLNEKDWKDAEIVEGFYTWNNKNEIVPAVSNTRVRVLWDNQFLYIGAEIDDKDIYAMLTKHNDPTWEDDVFEIFIKPDPTKHHFYEFHVTPLNTQLELFYPRRGFGSLKRLYRDMKMKSAVKINGTLNNWEDIDQGWIVEVAIPFSAFSKTTPPPKHGSQWHIAFCRYEYSYYLPDSYFSGLELSSSAALSRGNFHLHEEYDILRFEE